MQRLIFLIIGIIVATVSCNSWAKFKEKSFLHNNVERNYLIYTPETLEEYEKLPVFMLLHGGGSNMHRVLRTSELSALAAEKKFILVVPNAIDGRWNDGRKILYNNRTPSTADDIGFLTNLLTHTINYYQADASKVFIKGASNGGIMAFRMACEKSDFLTGIAPIIASMPKNMLHNCAPSSPIKIVFIAGTDDPLMPFEGETEHTKEPMLSIDESVSFWAKHNNCPSPPTKERLPSLENPFHSYVMRYTYHNCAKGGGISYYEIVGGGHHIPSFSKYRFMNRYLERHLGIHNHDISSAAEIWNFFFQD